MIEPGGTRHGILAFNKGVSSPGVRHEASLVADHVFSLWGSPAMAQSAAGVAMDPAGARRWLEDYVRIWSGDRAVNAGTINTYYAPVVTYYGKRMTRRQVLDDKRRYIRTYPGRVYEIVEGSVAVGCDGAQTLCTTSGVMRVQLMDRTGPEGHSRERRDCG